MRNWLLTTRYSIRTSEKLQTSKTQTSFNLKEVAFKTSNHISALNLSRMSVNVNLKTFFSSQCIGNMFA